MIVAGKATLHELRSVYCINDLADFHEMLDVEIELRAKQQKEADSASRRPRRR